MDHQTVGKADNIRAAVAKTTLHAVMIGAIRLGYGNFAVLNGNGVGSAGGGGDRKFLIDSQIDRPQDLPVGRDLGMGGRRTGGQENQAQS